MIRSLKKTDVSVSVVILANRLQKQAIRSNSFSPFYAQEQIAHVALRSFALF